MFRGGISPTQTLHRDTGKHAGIASVPSTEKPQLAVTEVFLPLSCKDMNLMDGLLDG